MPNRTAGAMFFVIVIACLSQGGNCQPAMRPMKRVRNITHQLIGPTVAGFTAAYHTLFFV